MIFGVKKKACSLLRHNNLLHTALVPRFISFNEAKTHILSHDLVSTRVKNLKGVNVESISTLAELFYTVVDPMLANMTKIEKLQLYSFLLTKTSSVEFGISNHILSELAKTMNTDDIGKSCPKSIISAIITKNPGRRYPHFIYLGELMKLQNYLKLDISGKDNEILLDFIKKLIVTEKSLEQDELVQNLIKIIYLFMNLNPETIKNHVTNEILQQIYNQLITTSSSNLLSQFLFKLSSVTQLYKDWLFFPDAKLDLTTPMQLYLVSKYRFQIARIPDRPELVSSLSQLVKTYGPLVNLSSEEKLAFDSIRNTEQTLYACADLTTKVDAFEQFNIFEDFLKLDEAHLNGNAADKILQANLARFRFITSGTEMHELPKDNLMVFEKYFQKCFNIITHAKTTTLQKFRLDQIEIMQQLTDNKNLNLSCIRLSMLTYSFLQNNEKSLDVVIELFNNNVESYLGTNDVYKLIETFVFCILVSRNLDLANYIKEGFVKNGTLKSAELKKLNKLFINYGELIELQDKDNTKDIFANGMKNTALKQFVENI